MMRKTMMVTVLATFFVGPLAVSAADPQPALDGNCPVCLVKMDKLVKGNPQFTSHYDGRTYQFPSEEQQRMFDADPTAFVPALGGDCTVCKVEMGKTVPGKAEFFAVHDGRLFLFPSEKQRKMFTDNPSKYADADLALGGNCAVCMVNSSKVVPGRPEYASVYDGRRYLFPGAEQKQKFDANPTAFAPALGGNCTVCKVEMNKDVPGKAEFFLVNADRLYLFPSPKQLNMFRDNPAKYANADVAFGGKCVVCKVEMNKDVEGSADFAVDFNGRRFLFPSAKQRTMFLANPRKYVAVAE